jgi:F-type H+-transporting ATPase subunit epsilon
MHQGGKEKFTMDKERGFKLRIITPERVFYENEIDMAEFNTIEGRIGVLPGHVPMTVIVKPGILNIHETNGQGGDGSSKDAALHAGFAEILPDKVVILAESVEWPEEIDQNRAHESMRRAEERLRSRGADVDVARAEAALEKAVARISMVK